MLGSRKGRSLQLLSRVPIIGSWVLVLKLRLAVILPPRRKLKKVGHVSRLLSGWSSLMLALTQTLFRLHRTPRWVQLVIKV